MKSSDAMTGVESLPPSLSSNRQSLSRAVESTTQYLDSLISARPECKCCKQSWRWPRNVSHMHIATVPSIIKPATKSTVVAHVNAVPCAGPPIPVIPEKVFRQLELVEGKSIFKHNICKPLQRCLGSYNKYYKLVDGFHYHTETGDIYNSDHAKIYGKKLEDDDKTRSVEGDDKQNEDDDNKVEYARLVTLASWYKDLFKCLRDVSFSVLDHYSNLILIGAIHFGGDSLWDGFIYSKYVVAVGWATLLTLSLGIAFWQSLVEYKLNCSRSKADIPVIGSLFDHWHTFGALLFFNFLMVTGDVKNIVTTLHPWKNVQPYAAIKLDGARAYVIGHKSYSLFKVQSRKGAFWTMVCLQLAKSSIFAFKAYVATCNLLGLSGDAPLYNIAVSCLTSSPSILMGWFALFQLWYHRRNVKTELQNIVKTSKDRCPLLRKKEVCNSKSCPTCTDAERQQADAARRILKHEFGIQDNAYSSNSASGTECQHCGRNRDDPAKFRPLTKADKATKIRLADKVQVASDQLHDSRFGCLALLAKKGAGVSSVSGNVRKIVEGKRAGGNTRYYVERPISTQEFTASKIKWESAVGYSVRWTESGVALLKKIKAKAYLPLSFDGVQILHKRTPTSTDLDSTRGAPTGGPYKADSTGLDKSKKSHSDVMNALGAKHFHSKDMTLLRDYEKNPVADAQVDIFLKWGETIDGVVEDQLWLAVDSDNTLFDKFPDKPEPLRPLIREHRNIIVKRGLNVDDMIRHNHLEVVQGWWYDERVIAKVDDVQAAADILLRLPYDRLLEVVESNLATSQERERAKEKLLNALEDDDLASLFQDHEPQSSERAILNKEDRVRREAGYALNEVVGKINLEKVYTKIQEKSGMAQKWPKYCRNGSENEHAVAQKWLREAFNKDKLPGLFSQRRGCCSFSGGGFRKEAARAWLRAEVQGHFEKLESGCKKAEARFQADQAAAESALREAKAEARCKLDQAAAESALREAGQGQTSAPCMPDSSPGFGDHIVDIPGVPEEEHEESAHQVLLPART